MKIKGLLLALGCLAPCAMAQTYTVKAEVHFENLEKVIVSEVERAKESIYVHIFKFNSKPIAQALIDAKKTWCEGLGDDRWQRSTRFEKSSQDVE